MNRFAILPNSNNSQSTKNSLPPLTGEDGEPLSYIAHHRQRYAHRRDVTH